MENLAILFAQGRGGGGGGAAMAVLMIIYIGVIVLAIAGMWAVFAKAGKPGWLAIIPIANVVVLLDIAGKPVWWIIIILLCPIVNIIMLILVYIDLAKSFNKGAGFAIGLVFLPFIFFPMLGFGDAQYQGPPPQ